jgi:hypothetical protein
MKKFFFLFSILLIAQNNIYSSNDTFSDNSYFEAVTDTIPNLAIFETETPLNISLEYDITSFIKDKEKGEYYDAILRIHYDNNQVTTKNIKLKVRGHFRREYCYFPPIYLNFKSDPIEKSGLTGKIKLVTHCSNLKKHDKYIIREYLAYKMFNVLSDYSFRVRLLNVTYIDTGERKKNYKRVGFLLEPVSFLSKRKGAALVHHALIREGAIFEKEADKVALFEYMIGNTDWKIKGGHNIKYFKPLNMTTSKVVPVPYDFDYSGFVGTRYSVPQTWTSVKNVYEREYLGFCRQSDEDYLNNVNGFNEKKEVIFGVIEQCEFMSDKDKKILSNYIGDFFSIIDKPKRIVQILKNECRTEFF